MLQRCLVCGTQEVTHDGSAPWIESRVRADGVETPGKICALHECIEVQMSENLRDEFHWERFEGDGHCQDADYSQDRRQLIERTRCHSYESGGRSFPHSAVQDVEIICEVHRA